MSAENVVAVAAAAVAFVVSVGMGWYERRVPRRKRIGYRVQMDNPIGDDVRSGRVNCRLGLFDEAPGMAEATLVLLRIENDGSKSISDSDYTGQGLHGLTAVFTDRTIRGVSVTQPTGTDHLMDWFTPVAGFGYERNALRIPRVPLNRGDHFKLLVLLSGGDVGSEIGLVGGLRGGSVQPNRSVTPDDKSPVFSRAVRLITALLTTCVMTLAVLFLGRDHLPTLLVAVPGALGLVIVSAVLWDRRRGPAHDDHAFYAEPRIDELARRRREIVLLFVVSVVGYIGGFFAARPLLRAPHPLGFDASETAQVIASIAGLASGIAAGAAAIIKAVGYLTYARADMVRARAGLPPTQSAEDSEAGAQPAAGE